MSELDARCLEAFGNWLRQLPADTESVAQLVRDESVAEEIRRPLASALNYLFKSIDLIDDGIESLGFLDDAFVLRWAARQAEGVSSEEIARLSGEAGLVVEFLGDLSLRFERYMQGLSKSVVRGRSVESIVQDPAVREELLTDLAAWASRYEKPNFAADPKNLIKLRAFLAAKLPA